LIRKIAVNLALFAAVILVCLGLFEIATRGLFGDQIPMYPRYHTSAQYGEFTLRRLRPNFQFWHTDMDGSWKFVTNGQGFRSDEDYHLEKPSGVFRVIALGDSTTEGFGVRKNDTYPAVLERYLRKNGINSEVFNTGISGFGTAEELIYLENEGIKYHPDAVVLGFFGNDFDDNARTDLFRLENGQLVVANKSYIPGVRVLDVINSVPLLRWLSENSYFYSFAVNTVWEAAKRARLGSNEAARETEFTVPTSIDKYKVDLTLALLHRLYAFCKSHGVILIVADIPAPLSSDPSKPLRSEPEFLPSIPADLQNGFRKNSDALILSAEIFAPYIGLTELHGLRGTGHPNEFSDLTLGIAIGEKIRALLNGCEESQRGSQCTALPPGAKP
jgi:GDSL-like Lipase/Acylhydrolase family